MADLQAVAAWTAQHDELLAHCRDWMRQQDEDEIKAMAAGIADATGPDNPPNCRIICHFALLGVAAAWLSANAPAEGG